MGCQEPSRMPVAGKAPSHQFPPCQMGISNGQLTKPAHQGASSILSTGQLSPQRKPLKQRQHGGEEGHDGSISFIPATHTVHTSITARRPQIRAALWMQFVT
ncbi:hypothetical protein JOQ06_005612, partial [Pogonophryne albipinna]